MQKLLLRSWKWRGLWNPAKLDWLQSAMSEMLLATDSFMWASMLVYIVLICKTSSEYLGDSSIAWGTCAGGKSTTLNFRPDSTNFCIDRESNPGLPRGRREFYHWTINASYITTVGSLFWTPKKPSSTYLIVINYQAQMVSITIETSLRSNKK